MLKTVEPYHKVHLNYKDYKFEEKMKEILNKILNYKNLFIILIFSFLLIIGILIFDDYGMSWDEDFHRGNGYVYLNYIRELLSLEPYPGHPNLIDYVHPQYGVIFDLPMVYLEEFFSIDDSKIYYLMRHFFNFFIFFLSSICFYLLLRKRFTYSLSIIGLLFFVLNPRIFSDSFYNMKDLIFLSFFVIGLYFSVVLTNTISYKNALIAALTCSLAIASRVMGIIIPFFVIIFFILESLDNKNYFTKNIYKIVFFFILCLLFTTILWPHLWSDPINNFFNTFKHMSDYTWEGSVFYFGNYISAKNLPWHYPLVFIFITTPMLYLFLYVMGSFLILLITFNRFLNLDTGSKNQNLWKNKNEKLDLLIFLIFFATLYVVIEINSTLYGGWRHLYFLYPSLIFLSVIGLEFLYKKFNQKYLLILVFPFLLHTSYWMIKNHPFQFVYFNALAGKNINKNFELDYWGTSNKSLLNYLLKNETKKNINVYIFSDSPYYKSLPMLDKEQRNRIKFVRTVEKADYLVSNHYYAFGNRKKHTDNPILLNIELKKKYKLFKEIKVDDLPINSVYKTN